MMHGRVIAYFQFSKWRLSAILDLVYIHTIYPVFKVTAFLKLNNGKNSASERQ